MSFDNDLDFANKFSISGSRSGSFSLLMARSINCFYSRLVLDINGSFLLNGMFSWGCGY